MERLVLEDFYDYQYVSDVCLSPDGQMAAFVITKADIAKNGYLSWIYLYNYGDDSVRKMTEQGHERAPVWLSDKELLYQSSADMDLNKRVDAGEPWTDIKAIDITSGETRDYMRIPAKVFSLWPLTGERFVIKCEYDGNYPGLHSCDADERARALAAKNANQDYLVADEIPFRHDGEGFYNNIRKRLAIFDRAAQTIAFLSKESADVELVAIAGDQIIYTAHQIVKNRRTLYPTGIYVYDLRHGTTEKLLDEDTYRIRFLGKIQGKIVFAGSDKKRYGNQENPWFYILNNGKPVVFAENEESAMNSVGSDCRYGGGASYQVREDGIYFLSTVGGDAVVKCARLDGSIETLTEKNGTVDCFDIGPNGIICAAMKNYCLQELYTIKDRSEKQVTRFNDWVHQKRAISRPEHITYDNCGKTFEGWVIKPVNYDPEKKYPGILDIHGGHKCAYGGDVYYHEMQLWSSEGYFVFFTNPRGSDGGGNEFAEIIGRYGEIDYPDLMKFTDAVLEMYPQLDKDNLAVTGGSYGGYMTNWVIGHTDRFKCAASQRSIANYISMFGTSDTGYSFPMYSFVSSLWEDPGRYWSHSPLKYADKVTTPTLFLHSENDYRCPISEGIQMFTALKFHGVEARLCMFKGEGHELSRSGLPLHRARRLKELTDWFNQHLKK